MSDLQRLGRRLTANYALIQCIFNMAYCYIFSFAAVFLLSRGFSNSEVGTWHRLLRNWAIEHKIREGFQTAPQSVLAAQFGT